MKNKLSTIVRITLILTLLTACQPSGTSSTVPAVTHDRLPFTPTTTQPSPTSSPTATAEYGRTTDDGTAEVNLADKSFHITLYDSIGERLKSPDLQVRTALVGGIPLVQVSDPLDRYLPAVALAAPTEEAEVPLLLTDAERQWDTFPLGQVDVDLSSLPLIASGIPLSDLTVQLQEHVEGQMMTLVVLQRGKGSEVPASFNLYGSDLPDTFVLVAQQQSQSWLDRILCPSVYALGPFTIVIFVAIAHIIVPIVHIVGKIYEHKHANAPDLAGKSGEGLATELTVLDAFKDIQVERKDVPCDDPDKDGMVIKQDPPAGMMFDATEQDLVLFVCTYVPTPTEEPTAEPTEEPTVEPTEEPTAEPTEEPAAEPAGGGRIAFASERDGNWEIYMMNADGSGQANLTNNPASDLFPSWSPDGTRIAFSSARDGNYEIYVMNADGSGVTRLTNNPATDTEPSWSPDGTRIAFASEGGGNRWIDVINADGSGLINLTSDPGAFDGYPCWSPDRTRIAFMSYRDNHEIYVMNADGSGLINLTNNPASDFAPSWSPDGTRIAFYSKRDGNLEIYVMNADGSGQTNLTNNPAWDVNPSWSPDGGRIAFSSDRDGNDEIHLMNADGSGLIRLTNNPADDLYPSWSPR